MEINDIFKLIDAGFTKEEILKLASMKVTINAGDTKPAEPTPAPAEDTPAPAEPTPAPAEPTPAPAEDTRLDDVIKGLQKVTETMQKTALQNTRQPEPESVDDILAKIINPTYNKE